MRSTGMVRRIDELGRVVIPKEIRKTMRLRVGEELEIFVDAEGALVFKKYSSLEKLRELAEPYVEALAEQAGCTVLATDADSVVAVAGDGKREYAGKHITNRLDRILAARQMVSLRGENCISLCGEQSEAANQIIAPIVSGGDVLGCIIMVSPVDGLDARGLLLAKTAADFFVRLN